MGEFDYDAYNPGTNKQLYCTFSSKFTPLNLIYESTKIDPSLDGRYQTEVVIMSSIFCTHVLEFPYDPEATDPVHPAIYPQIDKNQFWFSSNFLPKPSIAAGLINNQANFVWKAYYELKATNSVARLAYLDRINSATFSLNLLPEGLHNSAILYYFVFKYTPDG